MSELFGGVVGRPPKFRGSVCDGHVTQAAGTSGFHPREAVRIHALGNDDEIRVGGNFREMALRVFAP